MPVFYPSALRVFKIFLFLWLLAQASGPLRAQQIGGTVVDDNDRPVIGAFVLKVGSQEHSHTNEFGRFTLAGVDRGDTITVSLLGYEPQSIVADKVPGRDYRIRLETAFYDLGEIVVSQHNKEINVVADVDVKLMPVQSSQQLLRKVPGLFIGQHAGGGKAEQIFLRGFDVDHGTDVAISVDGMPVNMVSHAHGQGYADLHFVIPETVERIDFGKGPYYAERGNFNTAGYVAFDTKDRLDKSQLGLEIGNFNYQRALGMFKLLDTANQHAYLATEFVLSDGPFESPQNFSRNNFLAKYHALLGSGSSLSLVASHFTSQWDASGQIPERAVADGSISRFGAIDDTEGGNTSRTNLALNTIHRLAEGSYVKSNVFYSHYDFELFSNFTFFLEDPERGDQIRQVEDRDVFGLQSSWNKTSYIGSGSVVYQLGGGFRSDRIGDIGLSRTANRRELLEQLQLGDVNEQNLYVFADAALEFGPLFLQPALRYDHFRFSYVDRLDSLYNQQRNEKGMISPKLSVLYDAAPGLQFFVKSGIGFHSNDSRVVLSGEQDNILPLAFGAEVGALFKPARRMLIDVALWHLYLEQEFVYVGDAGIVEPSGRTRRRGVDLSLRYQLNDWLYSNADLTYTHARSIDDLEGENLIPLAPIVTASGGLSVRKNNFRASLQARHLGDRPANEDDSITARGYTIVDLSGSYDLKRISLGFAIENLFDAEWNETQFATESRLRDELVSVEEIHFTPGTPFFLKGIVRYSF